MPSSGLSRILALTYFLAATISVRGLAASPIMTNLKGCINIATSVDGFIAGKDGGLDWLNNQPVVEGEDFGFSDFLKSIDVMIMGRNTFDVVAGFGKEAWAYGSLPIVVWTRNVDNVKVPEWLPDSVSVQSAASPLELWKDLETKEEYKRAYVDGGKTIQSFLNAGLIHHMTLTRIPILLGDGIPLFDGNSDAKQRTLKHVSTQAYPNGFVISKYDIDYDHPDSKA
jgi:dihydrofolate reductase